MIALGAIGAVIEAAPFIFALVKKRFGDKTGPEKMEKAIGIVKTVTPIISNLDPTIAEAAPPENLQEFLQGLYNVWKAGQKTEGTSLTAGVNNFTESGETGTILLIKVVGKIDRPNF